MNAAVVNCTKRKRAANFSEGEICILVDLALQNKNVLENKKSDSVSWAEKNNTWEKIAEDFNAKSGVHFRTAEVIRSKYEVLKKNIRKKGAHIKKEMYKTGGGNSDIPEYLDYEKKLLEVIVLSVEGLPSIGDSDSIKCELVNDEEQIIMPNEPAENTETINKPKEYNIATATTSNTEVEYQKNVEVPLETENTNSEPAKRRYKWRPETLKTKKRSVLHVKTRAPPPTHEKFVKLAEAKNKLVELQSISYRAEAEYKEEERKKKLQLLDEETALIIQKRRQEEEIFKKQLELLNKQIYEQDLKNKILEMQNDCKL